MASAEIAQINSSIRSALGETAGTFRKAANDNNAMVSRIAKDITRTFNQQRAQISDLNDNIEEVAHHSQQTSVKVDRLSNIMSESVTYQSQMVNQLRSMVEGIFNTSKNIIGLQNSMVGAGGNTLLGKLESLLNTVSRISTFIVGGATIAAGGAVLGQQLGLFGGGGAAPGADPYAGQAANLPKSMKERASVGMTVAKQEFLKAGYSEEAAKAAAAGLIGNAIQESGLDPNKQHDKDAAGNYTGYGLFGHRDPPGGGYQRRTALFEHMQKAGKARNDYEEQVRFGAQELISRFKGLNESLKNTTNPRTAAYLIGKKFEAPLESAANYPGRMANAASVFSGGESAPSSSSPQNQDAQKVENKGEHKDSHGHIVSGAAEQVKQESIGGLPGGNIVALGNALKGQGLTVTGHNSFPPVGKHTSQNSAHYKDMAIDVNIPGVGAEASRADASARFDKLADSLTAAGYNVLWKTSGHMDHLHAQLGTSGVKPGSFWKGGGGSKSDSPETTDAGHGTSEASTSSPDASNQAKAETNPLNSANFAAISGGASYGQLQEAITGLMSGKIGGMTGGMPMSPFASGMNMLGGGSIAGLMGSVQDILGSLSLVGGAAAAEAPPPTGQMLQSMSQSTQTSELNRQAVVKEAQNQISTEIATQTATDKAVEDNNLRNSNRNEGRPIMSDYNRPEDKGWPEWLTGFGTGVYDEFIRHSGGIRKS